LTFVERPDAEDKADALRARQADNATVNKNNLVYDAVNPQPATPPNIITDYRTLPKWKELEQLRGLYPGMDKKQRDDIERQIRLEQQRIINDTHQSNQRAEQEYRQKHAAEIKLRDAPRETMEARGKTAELVEAERSATEAEFIKLRDESTKPADKHEGDYMLKVSPLGTMKPRDFSEAAGQIGTYNPITARKAVSYAVLLGSPVPRNPQTGELMPGANKVDGKPVVGRGATGFEVLGREGNYALVRMPDKVVIRVPLQVFNQFTAVRDKGYDNDRAWWAARRTAFEAAGKDDWLTRQVKSAKGAIQERLNR
jgi:hypothetical protein